MAHAPRIPKRAPHREGGMVMIEALVAILIFSIGILGIIGLQAMAVQQSSDARYRATAAQLADQLLGQMWTGDRTVTNLKAQYNTCTGTTCPGYTTWYTTVSSRLPGVTATTKPNVDIDAFGIVTITLYWRAPSDDPGANPHRFDLQSQIGQ